MKQTRNKANVTLTETFSNVRVAYPYLIVTHIIEPLIHTLSIWTAAHCFRDVLNVWIGVKDTDWPLGVTL